MSAQMVTYCLVRQKHGVHSYSPDTSICYLPDGMIHLNIATGYLFYQTYTEAFLTEKVSKIMKISARKDGRSLALHEFFLKCGDNIMTFAQ